MKVKFLSLAISLSLFLVCGNSFAQQIRDVEVPSDKVMMFGKENQKTENSQPIVNALNTAKAKTKTEEKTKANWRTKVDPKLYEMPQNYKVPYILK